MKVPISPQEESGNYIRSYPRAAAIDLGNVIRKDLYELGAYKEEQNRIPKE